MWIDYRQASRPHNNVWPPEIPKGPDSEKDFANQQAFMNWPEEAAVATVGPGKLLHRVEYMEGGEQETVDLSKEQHRWA